MLGKQVLEGCGWKNENQKNHFQEFVWSLEGGRADLLGNEWKRGKCA